MKRFNRMKTERELDRDWERGKQSERDRDVAPVNETE